MTKLPKQDVEKELVAADIWDDEWEASYWQDYWDGVHSGEMSWQWYMKLDKYKDWHLVIINPAHKNTTVVNWIKTEFTYARFEYEHEHFLIEREDVATMVALKWS